MLRRLRYSTQGALSKGGRAGCQGMPIDSSSAGALHQSLTALREMAADGALVDLVEHLVLRPMQMAKYFCTGEEEDREAWAHYALAVPFYTHFTSPIRRYPDIVVHRLLLATLDQHPLEPLPGLPVPPPCAPPLASWPLLFPRMHRNIWYKVTYVGRYVRVGYVVG